MATPASPSSPKTGSGTSWVWTYFKTSKRDGKGFNVCHANKPDGTSALCLKELAVDRSGSTKSMINHLLRKHGMIKPTIQTIVGGPSNSIPVIPKKPEPKTEPKSELVKTPKPKPKPRYRAKPANSLRSNLLTATSRFIVSSGVSYTCLEDPAFAALLEACHPGTKDLLVSPEAMRNHVLSRFQAGQIQLSHQLQNLDSFVSLTCDAWTSPAGHPMLEVAAHWIDKDWALHSAVIAFVRLDGTHTESNISSIVHRVLISYKIENKILCITGDSISHTALSGITLNRLLPRFHPNYHLVGSIAHVIDLAGKLLLSEFQEDAEPSSKADHVVTSISVNPNDSSNPRTIISRLYGLAGRLKDSVEAKHKFLETASLVFEGDALDVFYQPNSNWQSTYQLLDRALKLRDAINVLCASDVQSRKFLITTIEWDKVQTLLRFLKPLERLTKDITSVAHCTMMSTVPTFEWIIKRTKKLLTDHADPESLTLAFQMELLLSDYQRQALREPIYICSPVLDPRIKLSSVSDKPNSSQGESIADDLKEILKYHAKPFDRHLHLAQHVINDGEEAAHSSDDDDGPRFLKRRKKVYNGFDGEIESYFNGELEDESCEPLEYWKNKAEILPSLASMAKSYLAAQATTSSSSINGNNRRNALAVLEQRFPAGDVEAFACLKSWIGIVGEGM